VQTPLSGNQGILPALPRALHLESGKLRQSGLPAGDDPAAFSADFILAVFVFGDFYTVILLTVFETVIENYFLTASNNKGYSGDIEASLE
jgi:hypothetical protein